MKRFFWYFLVPMLVVLAVGLAVAPGGFKLALARVKADKGNKALAKLQANEAAIMTAWSKAA